MFAVLIGPLFDRIAATLVDAFVKRAEQVYAHD
jgi:ribosome-associated toxin RatA of RatAB toxin-antitoxin module